MNPSTTTIPSSGSPLTEAVTLDSPSMALEKVSMADIYEPIAPHMGAVKDAIKAIVPPESQLLAESLAHSLGSGGKLLRPALTLLMAKAISDVDDKVTETAAVSEMIHTATLLHDDVLDEADLRRNKKTVRAVWGNAVSILSGDYLLAQASRKLAAIGNIRVVAIFSDVLADLCDGEVEQIRTCYNLNTTDWDSYFRKSICKTASLFSASCEAIAVLNNLPEDQVQQLRSYGTNLGIGFQIMDDLLDITQTEAELGKPAMDDLKNGLLTAPALLALDSTSNNAPKKELQQLINQIFNADANSTVATDLTKAKALIIELGAIEQTRQLAQNYIEKAWAGLAPLADSEAKTALINLGQFVLQRTQ